MSLQENRNRLPHFTTKEERRVLAFMKRPDTDPEDLSASQLATFVRYHSRQRFGMAPQQALEAIASGRIKGEEAGEFFEMATTPFVINDTSLVPSIPNRGY